MVFFTCSHCGESVKKPSVAKHYQTKCRNQVPFLTCVDCLKDFKQNEYEAHTKCFTEEERYSGKGFVPKASKNKGEKKQKTWSECVQGLLSSDSIKQDERDLLQSIAKHDNIPRKKVKFINFLKTTARAYSNKSELIDRVWEKLESCFREAVSENSEKPDGEVTKHANSGEKKKDTGLINGAGNENASDVEAVKEEEKKKQKDHSTEEETKGSEAESKNKKAKKKKKLAASQSEDEPKTKKSKQSDPEEGVNGEEKMEKENKETVKGKNKKKMENGSPVKQDKDDNTEIKNSGTFNWPETILNVLSKTGIDNRMMLKKLQKKVLRKYCEAHKCVADEKVVKKFSKSLNKIDGITIKDNYVTLTKCQN